MAKGCGHPAALFEPTKHRDNYMNQVRVLLASQPQRGYKMLEQSTHPNLDY